MKRGFRFLQFFSTAIGLYLLATGASGAVLKIVQSGEQIVNAAPATTTIVNLTAVVPTNTFVICEGDTGGITSYPAARATCELSSATQLTITTGAADPLAVALRVTVRWYVVEFLSGVFVQRGLTTLAAGTPTTSTAPPALIPVNPASSFVLVTERMNDSASQLIDERWNVQAQLTLAGTNLQLTRIETGTAVSVAWQVIQIDSAAVQSGSTSIPKNLLFVTAALNPLVDINHTFLVFSRSGGTATAGEERRYQVTGQITAPGTITFTRAYQNNLNNTQVDIDWYAVRMTDGTIVQNNVCGPSGTGAASATMPNTPAGCLTIPIPITITRSITLLSTRGEPKTTAPEGTAPEGNLDDTSWRSTLAANAITLERAANASKGTNATVAWQVVQFNNTTNTIDRVEIVP